MKKRKVLGHILNVVLITLIVECFLCTILLVRQYAREDCSERIAETATQMSEMMRHALHENKNKLQVFSGILAANSSNPDDLLRTYMANFCKTQSFTAVCIHRADGSTVYYGEHPHNEIELPSYDVETKRLPYISEVYSQGDTAGEKCFYQAEAIVRDGKTVGVLYGYTSLDSLPEMISSTAYDGACRFYVVDGNTGDFLMDESHDRLGNIFSDVQGHQEIRDGYSMEEMRHRVRNGESGFLVFKSVETGEWYYTYYLPMGVNNWSMQVTIDEKTAFASYNEVSLTVIHVAAIVIALMVIHVLLLMVDSNRNRVRDQKLLHQSRYINEIQSHLMNAHNNPESLTRALKNIAQAMQGETALLLTLNKQTVNNAYYWPVADRRTLAGFVGRNIVEDFPMLYDLLAEGGSVYYDAKNPDIRLSAQGIAILKETEVRNVLIAPILDKHGALKGAISVANMPVRPQDASMLECITYDLFMAMMNVETHEVIKRMGAVDFLTNVKNRNSYESEAAGLAGLPGRNLWCMFIDVNGLRETNNTRGHKAGDLMLCSVADQVKRIFGTERTYRLGGDEFVAFDTDSSHHDFMHRKYAILEELAAMGYSASVGFAGVDKRPDGTFDLEKVVEDAETIMYQDKAAYYREHNIPWERGHFPESVKE